MKVFKGFKNAVSSGDPPTLKFTLPAIRNPRSTQPSGAFDVSIVDEQEAVLYDWKSNTSPTVTMTTGQSPASVSFSRDNVQNGALTDYEWTVTPNTFYSTGDIITIIPPNSVSLSQSTSCQGLSILKSSLDC